MYMLCELDYIVLRTCVSLVKPTCVYVSCVSRGVYVCICVNDVCLSLCVRARLSTDEDVCGSLYCERKERKAEGSCARHSTCTGIAGQNITTAYA